MQYAKDGANIVLKVDDGEDLFGCLETLIRTEKIHSGILLMGIGMLKDFELGYFNGKEYIKEKYAVPHELVSLKGSIANGTIHIHAALANERHTLIGGHLFSARASVLNEILIMKLENMKLTRVKNEKTGLMELFIHQ